VSHTPEGIRDVRQSLVCLPSPPYSGDIQEVFPRVLDDHGHLGQDAAFKKTIHDNVTSLPTPYSTRYPPRKKGRVAVEGAETNNLNSPEMNKRELRERVQQVSQVGGKIHVDSEDSSDSIYCGNHPIPDNSVGKIAPTKRQSKKD
jgi:hypothetical protein